LPGRACAVPGSRRQDSSGRREYGACVIGPCEDEVVPAVEDCAAPEDEDCDGVSASCEVWTKAFGNGDPSVGSYETGYTVTSDATGNVILCGSARGTVDFGGGPLSNRNDRGVVVAELDRYGHHRWSHWYPAVIAGQCMVATAGDGSVWMAGDFTESIDFGSGPIDVGYGNHVYLVRLDASGNLLSSAVPGEGWPFGLAMDASGAVAISGSNSNGVDFGGGPIEQGAAFVAKLDAEGNHLWSKGLLSSGHAWSDGVASTASGDVVVVGTYEGTPDFGGGALPTSPQSMFVLELAASDGSEIWSRAFDSTFPSAVAVDAANEVVIAGTMIDAVDFGGGALAHGGGDDLVVVKLTADGAHLWSKSFGDEEDQGSTFGGLTVDANGNVLVSAWLSGSMTVGGTILTSAGNDDVALLKLSSDGVPLFAMAAGDARDQNAQGIGLDPSGHLLVTGRFEGLLDFGSGPVTAPLFGPRMFVAKLAP
jgi:hypothetical protein